MTTAFSVSIPDLEAMAAVFQSASTDLATLPGGLASRADGPESISVSGGGEAAAKYAQALDAWRNNLTQIVSSLEILSEKVSAAAQVYSQTEAANTPTQSP